MYNFLNERITKELKVLNYYKKISSIEPPKITIIPKQPKRTKKNVMDIKLANTNKIGSNIEILENSENSENNSTEHSRKKLTQKKFIITKFMMDCIVVD